MLKPFIRGDAAAGYWLEFGDDKPTLRHGGGGEFDAIFANREGTAQEEVRAFRGQWLEEREGHIALGGEIALPRLDAVVTVRIVYRQAGDATIAKTIEIAADRELTFTFVNRLQALTAPDRYWTFQSDEPEGSAVYELYPAVGMVIGGQAYGLLTDNGFRNRWTRISRRKDEDGYLVGLDRQPDAGLTAIAGRAEREAGEHYVQLKFGELLDFTKSAPEPVSLAGAGAWRPVGAASLRVDERGCVVVTGDAEGQSGIELPLALDKNEMYEIVFSYRSAHKLALCLMDADSSSYFEWGYEYGAYRDNIPTTADGETGTFARRFFSCRFRRNHQPLRLQIRSDATVTGPLDFAVQSLHIRKYAGEAQPYHTVSPSSPAALRVFLFASSAASHREVQIAAQTKLAEGLGFQGTETEKIMYADNQMLIWIAQHDRFVPHLVPSLNYHPDMYLRDAFWHAQAIDDREVAESAWQRYAETQHEDGQLDTLVMPYFYRPSRDDNDSTLFYLMWACINRRKYGTRVDSGVLARTFGSIVRNHSPQRDGLYRSRTAGWLDTIWNVDKVRAINQGHYAVALQCARELGLDVEQEEIDKAKMAYRSLYDPEKQTLKWSEDEHYISPSVLLGEFLSLWLFDEPILSDEQVVRTVERFPVIGRGVPCICNEDGSFFTERNKPWEGKYTWPDGVYHNGGSWFLYEYLAYAAAARHGWEQAVARMRWRVEMEFGREREPYSHEFIPLSDKDDDWWPTTGVFAWNTFMIVANRVAAGVNLFPANKSMGKMEE